MADNIRRLREFSEFTVGEVGESWETLKAAGLPVGLILNGRWDVTGDQHIICAAMNALPALLDVAEAAFAVFEDLCGYDDDPENGVRLGAALVRLNEVRLP